MNSDYKKKKVMYLMDRTKSNLRAFDFFARIGIGIEKEFELDRLENDNLDDFISYCKRKISIKDNNKQLFMPIVLGEHDIVDKKEQEGYLTTSIAYTNVYDINVIPYQYRKNPDAIKPTRMFNTFNTKNKANSSICMVLCTKDTKITKNELQDKLKFEEAIQSFEKTNVSKTKVIERFVSYQKNKENYCRTNRLWVSETKITIGMWKEVMGINEEIKKWNNLSDSPSENLPIKVSYIQAIEYCNELSRLNGFLPYYLITKEKDKEQKNIYYIKANEQYARYSYRLPKTDEWAHFAKCGQTDDVYLTEDILIESNIKKNENDPKGVLLDVKAKKPNEFGLYSVIGGLEEWLNYTQNNDAIEPIKELDGVASSRGATQNRHGGYWEEFLINYALRITGFRWKKNIMLVKEHKEQKINKIYDSIGFRVVRDCEYV